jgi:general secretion pathway protein K
LLVSIYAVYVTRSASAISVDEDGLQAEAMTSAAVELTAGRLLATTIETRPSRGSFVVRMPSAGVNVAWLSEASRVDLNAAPKELLSGLFVALGAGPLEAATYADRIVAWRTPSKGAEADSEVSFYRSAGLSYNPRLAPFQHVDELWLLAGVPPVLIEHMMPLVTVFSGRSSISVMDAPPLVLAALPGMARENLQALIAQRGAADVDPRSLLGLVGDARGLASVEAAKAVRIRISIRFDNGRRAAAEVVILPKDDGDEPYRVLSWSGDPGGVSPDKV